MLDQLNVTLSIVIALLTIALALYRIIRVRRRHRLTWTLVEATSLLTEEMAPGISITFCDAPIKHLTKYRFVLHNNGLVPITKDDMEEPLRWRAPGRIIKASVVVSRPEVVLELATDQDALDISWRLFNQRCMALIDVLCDANNDASRGSISGQIRNIPVVDQREALIYSEEETIKRLRSTLQLVLPGFAKPMGRFVVNKISIRIVTGLAFAGIVVGPSVVLYVNQSPLWLMTVAFLFGLGTGVGFLSLWNHPYSKLLSMARSD